MLTVDEEIYRLTPSLVIATVDKLAQLPWKAATATLFGLVDTRVHAARLAEPRFFALLRAGRAPGRGERACPARSARRSGCGRRT